MGEKWIKICFSGCLIFLICFVIDGKDDNPNHIETKQKFNDLIAQNANDCHYPLIRYEVLQV